MSAGTDPIGGAGHLSMIRPEAFDQAWGELPGDACHVVTLILDDQTGRVLFWHRTREIDVNAAVVQWGKPVGTAFGTSTEIWLVGPEQSARFYGCSRDERFPTGN